MPKIKQSETIIILRSKIKFAPYNPRKEDKKVVEKLKRNFKKIGYCGGIVWNEKSGNLISGHKRITAMDIIYNYTSTTKKANDYKVKVEKVSLSDREEKEQNIFMNSDDAQAQFDNLRLSELLQEIDYKEAGLDLESLELLQIEYPQYNWGQNNEIKKDLKELKKEQEKTEQQKKEYVKTLKKQLKNNVSGNQMQTHFSIVFNSYNEKAEFLESLGINGDEVIIDSRKFISKIREE